jgi:hypothetical protein
VNASASAQASGQFVVAWAQNYTTGYSSASASFSEDYALTVFGGSGAGFAEPIMSAQGDSQGGMASAIASATLENSSGGCETGSANEGPPLSTCGPGSVPFVFGVPQTLTLSLAAYATSGDDYSAGVQGAASGYVGFEFFVNGDPYNATYTFTPGAAVPEPGMFPVLAAMACVALIARLRGGATARPETR